MDVRLNTNLTAAVQTAAPVQAETAQESGAPARTPHYLSDQLFISAEGRAAVEEAAKEQGLDPADALKIPNIDELDAAIEAQWPEIKKQADALLAQNQLPVNLRASVDPDGAVWQRAYFDSLTEQIGHTEQTIRDYYAEEHAKNTSMPFDDAWNYIREKYLDCCSGSPYFRSDMSPDQRQTAYWQERFLLTTGRVYTLNDPYALASIGGPVNHFDMEKAATAAADSKIDALIRERFTPEEIKENERITAEFMAKAEERKRLADERAASGAKFFP